VAATWSGMKRRSGKSECLGTLTGRDLRMSAHDRFRQFGKLTLPTLSGQLHGFGAITGSGPSPGGDLRQCRAVLYIIPHSQTRISN
jgi:hypothetical protein